MQHANHNAEGFRDQEPEIGPQNFEYWRRHISETEMPIFPQTLRQLSQMADDQCSTASDFSRVILNDPGLTPKILRVANSCLYNPHVKRLNTVSRATVVLGLQTIYNIGLSCSLIEPFLHGYHHDAVAQLIKRSIHAAVIAKLLAQTEPDAEVEETFITTLLLELGHFAFLCSSNHQAEKLLQAQREKPDQPAHRVQLDVLGFQLSSLTRHLCQVWHLGDKLLQALIQPEGGQDKPCKMRLSHEYAALLAENPKHPALPEVRATMAKALNLNRRELDHLLSTASEMSSGVMRAFGLESLNMPLKPVLPRKQHNAYVQTLAKGLHQERDVGKVFAAIAKSIHHSLGMDRTLFFRLSSHLTLHAKIIHTSDTVNTSSRLEIPLKKQKKNCFHYVLKHKIPLYFPGDPPKHMQSLKTQLVKRLFKHATSVFFPVLVDGKVIGLFTADRSSSQRPISLDEFSRFTELAAQARVFLSNMNATELG